MPSTIGRIEDRPESLVDEHTLTVLEYYRLRDILKELAASEPGRQVLDGLRPRTGEGLDTIAQRLARAGEMQSLVELHGGPPLEDIPDIAPLLSIADKSGAILNGMDIQRVGRVLRTGRLVRGWLHERGDTAPLLASDVEPLVAFGDLEKRIHRSFDGGGNVLDEASPRLAEIRREGASARRQIVGRLEALIHDAAFRGSVQEDIVTQRAGRYVIPLKAGADPHVRGIVHDRSASGATFFVEPMEVVHDNNRLALLAAEEKAEIDRILAFFTREIGVAADKISALFHMVAEIDALAAIGRFAADTRGAIPHLVESGSMELRSARHPLLLNARKGNTESVVPLDLRLDEGVSTLLVTGPNAGGKTVALKTVGIMVLMLCSGIPVPVSPDSRVPLFRKVFADIGDEQSIEAALSTYSGHVRRLGQFLREAGRGSLVLVDEMGAGTDPEEGGALAAAMLEGIQKNGALCIVTTHLGFLKEAAARTPGMLNASMAFEAGTKRPTYRLIIGEAGMSNPLRVAEELGLPASVIERARGLRDSRTARLDGLIEELAAEKANLEAKLRHAAEAEDAADRLRREAGELKSQALEEARRAREKAGKEAKALLGRVKDLLKEAERASVQGEQTEDQPSAGTLLQEVAQIEALCRQEQHVPRGTPDYNRNYRPSADDWVRVAPFGKVGRVVFVAGETAEVLLGTFKARVPVSDLEPVREPIGAQDVHKTQVTPFVTRHADEATSRLDLLGRRVDEALDLLDKFLDHSFLDGLYSVTIVHGIGTGALKDAVASFLKGHVHVADFRPGEQAEGGAGVTIVTLR